MDIDKVLYHLKEAEKELGQFDSSEQADNGHDHQSYLLAMSQVFDFVNSLKPFSCTSSVVRDDY